MHTFILLRLVCTVKTRPYIFPSEKKRCLTSPFFTWEIYKNKVFVLLSSSLVNERHRHQPLIRLWTSDPMKTKKIRKPFMKKSLKPDWLFNFACGFASGEYTKKDRTSQDMGLFILLDYRPISQYTVPRLFWRAYEWWQGTKYRTPS